MSSDGSVMPFSAARIIGDLVLSAVPGDVATARCARLYELLQALDVTLVSTEALRRALGDLANTIDGPPVGEVGLILREQQVLAVRRQLMAGAGGVTVLPAPGGLLHGWLTFHV